LIIKRGLNYREALNNGFLTSVPVTPSFDIIRKDELIKMKNNVIAFTSVISKMKKMRYLFFLSERQAI